MNFDTERIEQNISTCFPTSSIASIPQKLCTSQPQVNDLETLPGECGSVLSVALTHTAAGPEDPS